MANPSKSSDPAAAAMSAIEEALNLVDIDKETGKDVGRQSGPPLTAEKTGAASAEKSSSEAPRLPNVNATELQGAAVPVKAPEPRVREERKSAETPEVAVRPAANDDRPSVGQILQSLQERPSGAPYVLATLVSLAWLGVAGFYVYTLYTSGQWPLPVSQAALLALVAFGPVAFFFATASLARRAQEMRMTARSMQQVAIRLAEPETVATEQVVTLSQAIRREVASMGDGIERALARASELETVLRSEVTNLERSYGDNERRIRSLIDELASEREAIIGNADRLRQSISGAHEKLSQELEVTSTRISERVEETGSRVTSSLGSKAEEINLMLARNGDSIVERIGAQSSSIIEKLTVTGDNLSSRLTDVSGRMTETLSTSGEQVVSRIQSQGDAFTSNLTQTGDSLTERISAEATRVVGTLNEAGANIARNLSDTSIDVTFSLTALGDSLVSRLNAEGQNVSTNVSRLSENLLQGLGEATTRIGQTIGGGDELAVRLSGTADLLAQSVDVHGAALEAALGAAHEQIEKTLAERTQAAADLLRSTGETFAADVAGSVDKLSGDIALHHVGFKTALSSANEEIENTFAARARAAADLLESNGGAVTSRITEAVERLSENIALHGVGLETALVTAGDRIDQVFAARSQASLETMETNGAAVTSRITEAAERLADNINLQGVGLETALATAGERIDQAFSERAQTSLEAMEANSAAIAARIDASIGKLSEDVMLHSVGLETAVATATGRIDETLTEKSRAAVESLQSSGEDLVNRLAVQTYEVYERFTSAATDAVSAIGTHSDRVNEAFAERIGVFETTFAAKADEVTDRVAGRARDVASLMDKQLAEFDEATTARTKTLSEAFATYVQDFATTTQTRAETIAKTLDESARGFSDVADRSARGLTDTLRERLAALDEAATSRGSALEQTLSGLIERIDTGLMSRLQSMSDGISKQANEASRILDHSARQVSGVLDPSAIEATIGAKIRDLNVTLADRSREVLDNLREGAKAVEAALDADVLKVALSGKIGEIDALLSDRSRELIAQMTDNAQALRAAMDPAAMEATISTKLSEVEQTMAERSRAIVESIDTQVASLKSAIDPQNLEGALSDRIAQLNSAVAQRNTELLSTLVEGARAVERALDPAALEGMLAARIQEIGETIETRGRTLDDSLRQVTQRNAALVEEATSATERLSTAVNASGENLRSAIESSAASSVRSLMGVNEKLRNDLPALLENLAATNRSLQEIIDQAGTNFVSIEGALGQRIGDFRHSLETLFNQVGSLSRTADAAVDSAGSLSQRLENQSRELAEAATVLAQTQLQLDSSLATRQDSLEQLLEGVQGRTEGFESAVRAFTQMVEDAFTTAERRSRDIGLFLASETRNVAGLIGKQYEEVRSASEAERERSLEAAREAYAATVAEMSRSFEQATERFRDGADQMRSVTVEIRRELDATREEIRRGALELPKETSEQTAAVRRVLADQVRALNELTNIVDRSSRALGSMEPLPVRSEPTRALTTQAPAVRTVVEPPRQPATHTPVAPAAAAPVRQSDRPAAPAPAGKVDERGAGWLSDLLARASRDEGSRADDPVADIARNIGRYLDHDAAVNVWDRYYRGDQNVFTRSMYSSQGQLAFEEARRRYRSERPFRDAVDTFAEDFERQLQKIGAEDRDGSMIRAHLTSDSGKAYTLLAHSAGRFDAV